ncbi:hypothetical protein N8T08_005421 [Aspergillus melleus]|uniref:Uncharacterized protein n=1 Tax=Aspergillus melleus TaxID=138277 RepID=A0ACC3B2S9_9EURO|nr:hypothetical protein N8T08_005421 [Aspergillus melleus]
MTGDFSSSKLDGAKWAMQQPDCPAIVERAVAARKTGGELPAAQVMTLYEIVMKANCAKLATEVERRWEEQDYVGLDYPIGIMDLCKYKDHTERYRILDNTTVQQVPECLSA